MLLEAQGELLVLTSELKAAQCKYQHPEQTCIREKETVHINEKILAPPLLLELLGSDLGNELLEGEVT